MAAQHAQKLQPLIIGAHRHAQALVAAHHHLPDQQSRRKDRPVARGHNPVAGAHKIGILQKLQQRQRRIVARQQTFLPRRLHHHRDLAVGIGQQDHPAGALAHPRNPADQPDAVHRRPALHDAVAGPDVQQHRLAERAAAVGQHHPGDMGQLGIETHRVQVQQPGVLLLQLQRRLFPGLHLLKFIAQLLVLFIEPLIALEIVDHGDGLGHRHQRPVERGHHLVDQRRAEPLDARAVDAPQQEQRQQHQHQQPDQNPAQGARKFLRIGAVPCHGRPFDGRLPDQLS